MAQNNLYPIFLKVSHLEVLIVGGGYVAFEKLTFLLKSSPDANITIVSPHFLPDVIVLASKHQIKIIKKSYDISFLEGKHLVITTTNFNAVNVQVYKDCKKRNILVNVADNPEYCDFYLGGIVTKGSVKIAISTNGKSPTLTKRLRQLLEEILPEEINDLADNLYDYRSKMKVNFSKKVEELNNLTKTLLIK